MSPGHPLHQSSQHVYLDTLSTSLHSTSPGHPLNQSSQHVTSTPSQPVFTARLPCLSVLLMTINSVHTVIDPFQCRHLVVRFPFHYILCDSQTTQNIYWTLVSVCLSASACPRFCTDQDVNWGNGRGCPLVVHHWADLQLVHGLRCYDNIARTWNVSDCLYLRMCLICILISRGASCLNLFHLLNAVASTAASASPSTLIYSLQTNTCTNTDIRNSCSCSRPIYTVCQKGHRYNYFE